MNMFSSRMPYKINFVSYLFSLKHSRRLIISRNYAAPKSRFYKQTGILQNDGWFEVTLDQRKLKTPQGHVFQVNSESLARAVATEWDSQQEKIDLGTMFLTGICSTAIDNPGNLTKFQVVDHMIKFIDTDTVLFFSSEEDDLCELQMKEWNPIIQWACQRYGIDIKPSHDIQGPDVSHKSRQIIRRQLLSHNEQCLHGLAFAVETLKSLILTLACSERVINVDKAVSLSRLEEEYQTFGLGRGANIEDAYVNDVHHMMQKVMKNHVPPIGREKMRMSFAAETMGHGAAAYLLNGVLYEYMPLAATATSALLELINDAFDSLEGFKAMYVLEEKFPPGLGHPREHSHQLEGTSCLSDGENL